MQVVRYLTYDGDPRGSEPKGGGGEDVVWRLARSSQRVIDLVVLTGAFTLAFLLRFDWAIPGPMIERLLRTLPFVVGFQYTLLVAFGIPRFSWRFVGLRETVRVLEAVGIGAGSLLIVRTIAARLQGDFPGAEHALVPVGVTLIDLVLAFLAIVGVRGVRRVLGERADASRRLGKGDRVPTLLVGAGQAGLIVAKELEARPDLGIRPIGFLDDDRFKWDSTVHGIPVLGSTDRLDELAKRLGAKQVLIAIANAPGKEIRRIKELCDQAALPAKIIPGIYEIVGGRVNLSRIRSVSIEDLLRREPVSLDMDVIGGLVRGKAILVTGAGGSSGSELCRQLCTFGPARLVLVEQAENALFHIHRELVGVNTELARVLVPCIANITDKARLEVIFAEHRPELVFHAAAHKHVPMMEWNAGEAVKNNVFGTRALADVAHAHGVDRFVMISTDKAVNPTSVMGCSKRIAEIYVQALAQRSKTRFVTVRFGNVLGSNGSVIPIFLEQIARGGPVTVTDPEMRRYFMTIPEACQLVLQAGTMGRGGEIFVLDMGDPVKIVDLASDLICLSGFKPGEDIDIEFTGIRPGEKLFEELSVAEESADKTRHPKIFVGRFRPHDWTEIQTQLLSLRTVAEDGDAAAVRAKFQEIVPEYRPVLIDRVAPASPADKRAAGNGELERVA
jgi:FlaA1/EpsC-like NDP-sugar epimerase